MAEHVNQIPDRFRIDPNPPFAPFGIINNLDLLNNILIKNAEIYEAGKLQDQRDAVCNSLLSVVSYLSANGIANSQLKPLLRAVGALQERENNSPDKLFCERQRVGAPKRSMIQDQQDGLIAAFADHWLENVADRTIPMGNRRAEIARILQGLNLGPVSPARVKQAKELVAQERPSHPSRQMYDIVKRWLSRATADFGAMTATEQIRSFVAQSKLFAGDVTEQN